MNASTTAPHDTADLGQVRAWLNTLYGGVPGLLNISSTGNWSGGHFATDQPGLDAATAYVAQLDQQGRQGIYARVTTLRAAPARDSRGHVNDSLSWPGFWADLDINGPGHKHEVCATDCDKRHTHVTLPLPPDVNTAREIVTTAGLPTPTMWAHSGGGLYPWWLLDQPHTITADDLNDIATLTARWQHAVKAGSEQLGYHYGSGVGDLTRVLRIPGTINRKAGLARPCTLLETSGITYPLDELAALLYSIDLPDPTPAARQSPPPRTQPATHAPGQVGPFDALAEIAEWADLFAPQGLSYVGSERDGAQLWRRDGASSMYSVRAWPHVAVNHSENLDLPVGAGQRLTMGRVFAHWHHRGDTNAAGTDLIRAAASHPDATPAAKSLRPAILDHIRTRCAVRPWTPNTPPPANDTPWPDDPDNEEPPPAANTTTAGPTPPDVRRAMATADEQALREGVYTDITDVHTTPWSLPGSDTAPAVLPTFPLHCLPGDSGKFVEAVATYTQTPVEIPAFAAIGALATAVGSHATISGQWTEETLALWLTTIADSGDGKSRAFKEVNKPVYRLQWSLRTAWDGKYGQRAEQLEIAQHTRDKLIKDLSTVVSNKRNDLLADLEGLNDTIKELTGPPRPQMLAGDILPEALAVLMHKVGGHIGIVSAEGTFFGNICGRYNNGKPNLEFVLQAWDASEPWCPDRISRDSFELERPSLALNLSVQPVVIADAIESKAVTDKGLLNRFLLARPTSLAGSRDVKPPQIPAHLSEAWSHCVYKAFYAVRPEGITFDEDGSPLEPVPMQVSEDAEDLMLDWRARHERRLDPDTGDLAVIKGWLSRAPGNGYRLAALLHLAAGHNPRVPVSADTMADALAIIDYCVPHAIAILAAGEGSKPAAGQPGWIQAACGHVFEWIRKKGMTSFTTQQAYQGMRKRSWVIEHKAPGMSAVLVSLAAEGWLATVARKDVAGRRLPDPLFVPHPELLGGLR